MNNIKIGKVCAKWDERISQDRILMFWVSPADSCTNDCDQPYVVYYQQSAIQRTCWPQFKRGGCRIPSRRVASIDNGHYHCCGSVSSSQEDSYFLMTRKTFCFITHSFYVWCKQIITKFTLHITHCSWKVSSMNGIKVKVSVVWLERIVAWPQLDSGWRQELEWSRSGAPLLLFYQLIYWP